MDMSFRDHFSSHSSFYSEFRPGYPKDLFYYLKNLSPHGKTVWDCGTGTGQAAVPLGELFEKVIASDPSENQIVNAEPHQNVEYRVCKAENSTLGNHEVDLITVAQAFHWFDFNPFYKEVIRVGKKKEFLPSGATGYIQFLLKSMDLLINSTEKLWVRIGLRKENT